MTYNPAGGKTYTLAASISSTATSITLSSFALPVSGTLITMAVLNTDIAYGTIGPKTSSAEFISFTGITQNANGTATLTGVTRGLDKVSPFTTNATYKLPHSGQTLFILSDAPQVFDEYAAKRSANTFGPVQEFTLLPTSSGGNAINNNQLVTYAQAVAMATGTTNINRIVVAGNAGETVTAGQLLYLLVTDGEWYKCDADTAATVDNIILGIAQGGGTDGVAITSGVLLFGLDSNQTGLTNNTAYYASNTAGAISSTVGTVEVSVGISRSTTSLLFYPRYNQQITEDQQDALAGNGGTPSASNKYVTETGLTTSLSTLSKFGGTGVDGALNVTSGTTTIDCASANFVIKNYSSINISGGATLAFSNPATDGTVVYLKCTGDVTIAGTINASGNGTSGGASGSGANGTAGTALSTKILIINGGGTGGSGATNPTTGGAGGIAATSTYYYIPTTNSLAARQPVAVICGTGGGGGGGNGTNGAGGRGGGALYIECKGAWNFTGTINVSGVAGSAGAYSGGGGGGAGMLLVLYNTLTASSGTVTNNSGAGGSGGSGGNSGGGGGGNCPGGTAGGGASSSGAGTAGTNGGGGGGGAFNTSAGGASSTNSALSLITKNDYFA